MASKQLISLVVQCFIIYNICGLFESSAAQFVQVNTAQGTVLGRKDVLPGTANLFNFFLGRPYFTFLGIPFGQPPVGMLRFKSPKPAQPWTGVKNALLPGPECFQIEVTGNFEIGKEDCLYLNVYSPLLPTKDVPLKAVMVWIYGGAFKSGSGYILYGPDFLVPKDVLLVTFNYRLGPLGFLSLENDRISGNFGLKDQVLALKWVQQNIANFGGDPKKVTIFGESAGGASVHYQMLSPLSKGLFQRAIVQSGTALSPWAYNPKPKETAIRLAQAMGFNSTNTDELYDFFMTVPPSKLTSGNSALFDKDTQNLTALHPGLMFVPCKEVDGSGEKFITQSPIEIIEGGNFTKIPTIMGTLDGDGMIVLAFKKLDDEDFKRFNQYSDWAVPLEWNIPPGEEKNQIGKIIKRFYFQEQELSFRNINTLTDLYTDLFFVLGTQRALTAHTKNTNASVYSYEFTLETSRSIKLLIPLVQFRITNLRGAAHADEIMMLFVPSGIIKIPLFPGEKEISDKMVAMWTNFAKTGNPSDQSLNVDWKPFNNNNPSYVEFGSTVKVNRGKVQQQRLDFWKRLCEAVQTNFPCSVL